MIFLHRSYTPKNFRNFEKNRRQIFVFGKSKKMKFFEFEKNGRFFFRPKIIFRSKKFSVGRSKIFFGQVFFVAEKKYIFFGRPKKYFVSEPRKILGAQLRCKKIISFDLRGFQTVLSSLTHPNLRL